MTTDEKLALLYGYEDIPLTNEHFLVLQSLASDRSRFVKGWVAKLLVGFETEASKHILIKLTQDKNFLVRTEAYDSLCIFAADDVAQFLKTAVEKETSAMARSYAILSWTDVKVALSNVSKEDVFFLEAHSKREQRSAFCRLHCYCGLYRFGDKTILEPILSFLKHRNYRMRCAAIHSLEELIDEDTRAVIVEAVAKQLPLETTVAVKSTIETFLSRH